MTDTNPLEPTDAELTAIYKAANGEDTGKAQPLTTQRIFRAMRAAIAKWGAQQAPDPRPVIEMSKKALAEELAAWDAINVGLQQILDDMSCWEGRHAEHMCERLETAIKRLNTAVGHEREGYETAIALGYENGKLREQIARHNAELSTPKGVTQTPGYRAD